MVPSFIPAETYVPRLTSGYQIPGPSARTSDSFSIQTGFSMNRGSVGSRTGAILERAGFQPPPQQTQRADFPHWAFLCASRQGLCGFFVLVDFQLLALYTTR